jgi:MFS family permease
VNRPQAPIVERSFIAIFGADAVVRSAYQVGKSPVLPIFAASLGATDAWVGMVASASVMTGIWLKPLVGAASDRTGRVPWMWAALACFVVPPFLYGWVRDTGDLLGLRMVHGLATAFFGPVSVAYVVAMGSSRVAERVGWFGIARGTGSVSGPLIGAALLTLMAPAQVYTVVGLMSLTAAPMLWSLRAQPVVVPAEAPKRLPSPGAVPRAVWVVGGIEALLYMGTYAMKTFLPLSVFSGTHVGWVGLALSAHEAVALLLQPPAGRWTDRVGAPVSVMVGAAIVGVALPVAALVTGPLLVPAAALVGVGQALLAPASTALAAASSPAGRLGERLGWLGSMRNAGKVAGPVIAGFLSGTVGFVASQCVLGVVLVAGAVVASRGVGRR